MYKHRKLILLSLLASGAGLLGLLAKPVYTHFSVKGHQAEAKVMLTYIHSLEKAFKLENAEFAYFDAYYGAPDHGELRCERPLGAVELGFRLPWCDREEADLNPGRYAYRVVRPEENDPLFDSTGFQAYAKSGSKEGGKSLVCKQPDQVDTWYMDLKKVPIRIATCERL